MSHRVTVTLDFETEADALRYWQRLAKDQADLCWYREVFLARLTPDSYVPTPGDNLAGKPIRIIVG